MKFISKNSNLRVILTPSLSAEPLAGRPAVRGLFVKFEDGIANVVEQQIIDLMLAHPGYNSDYIVSEESGKDPYMRRPTEPEHNIVEINYGHVGKNLNPATPVTGLPAEMKKAISDMAMAMAKEMTQAALKDLTPKLTAEILGNLRGMAAEIKESENPNKYSDHPMVASVTNTETAEPQTRGNTEASEEFSLPEFGAVEKKKPGRKKAVVEN
jgi:hypothetical protein